jgi:CheY-like chemotaxis protein
MTSPAPGTDAALAPVILVVDDFPDGRELAVDTLTHAGFRVVEAADGLEAIEQARALVPALILMDLALPGIDGWEVMRRLREDDRTRDIPVVALTAHALKTHADRARLVGCEGFLTKPCSPRTLVTEVRRVLESGARR